MNFFRSKNATLITTNSFKLSPLRRRFLLILLGLAIAFTATLADAAITVTTLMDENNPTDNLVSLREAITQANNTVGAVIQFSVQGTIYLNSPLPTITSNMTITATPIHIAVDALPPSQSPPTSAQKSPIFHIGAGANVTITGLRIADGRNHGVLNEGILTLASSTVTDNSATQTGGGIDNYGTLYVTHSLISDNTVLGHRNVFGGGIANFGNARLFVASSTVTGNVAKGSDGVKGTFLERVSFDTNDPRTHQQMLTDAENYYELVDPGYKANPDGSDANTDSRSTLGHWWVTNGFNPDGTVPGGATGLHAQAAYLNNNDLGFGRDMHILQTSKGVAGYVSNYSLRPQPDQNPFSADFAQAKDPTRARATVCMEYSPIECPSPPCPSSSPVVKFFVYNGTGPTAPLVPSADLDGNGQKYVPQLCMVCHGGSVPSPFPTPATTGTLTANPSYFREFDLASFRLPRPGTRVNDPSRDPNQTAPHVDEETKFRSLNQLVLDTHPSVAIQELICGLYGNQPATCTTLPSVPQNTGRNMPPFVPAGWQDPGGHPEIPNLYSTVVAKSCRTCHVAQQFPQFTNYSEFFGYHDTIKNDVLTGPGTGPTPAQKVMPHAQVTFSNFWRSGRAQLLATFSSTASPTWSQIGYDSTNVTGKPQGGVGFGGGIYDLGSSHMAASTVAFNTAIAGVGTGVGTNNNPFTGADGGAILKTGNLASDVTNSLIADSFTMLEEFAPSDIGGDVASQGHNLFGITPSKFVSTDLHNIVDPKIGGLNFNGGFNPTHALLSGSPAIDKGSAVTDPFTGNPITTDQRGFARPANGPDIGAFERPND